MDGLAEALRGIVLAKLESGSLTLPVFPDSAHQAQRQLQDRDVSLDVVGKTISRDPTLAAQMLRLANSAAFRAATRIDNLPQAVSRVGSKGTLSMLRTAVAKTIFVSRVPKVQQTLDMLWDHSMVVAHMARDIAGITGALDANPAFLAGLLHDVGKPIIAGYLGEVEQTIGQDNAQWISQDGWIKVVQEIHRPIGTALAAAWRMPDAVCQAIEAVTDYDPADRASPVNAVRFANALAKKAGVYVGEFDPDEVSTQVTVGKSLLGIEDEVVTSLVEKAATRGWD